MAYTYSKLATVTVGSGGSSSIDFIAIPQNYTDLVLKISSRMETTNNFYKVEFNSSTSSYSNRRLYGSGSVATSFSGTIIMGYANRSDYTANSFDNTEIYIPNYTSSNYKSVSIDNVTETNATNSEMALLACLWSNSAAINSIKITPDSGEFNQYSTATLYGIKAEV